MPGRARDQQTLTVTRYSIAPAPSPPRAVRAAPGRRALGGPDDQRNHQHGEGEGRPKTPKNGGTARPATCRQRSRSRCSAPRPERRRDSSAISPAGDGCRPRDRCRREIPTGNAISAAMPTMIRVPTMPLATPPPACRPDAATGSGTTMTARSALADDIAHDQQQDDRHADRAERRTPRSKQGNSAAALPASIGRSSDHRASPVSAEGGAASAGRCR